MQGVGGSKSLSDVSEDFRISSGFLNMGEKLDHVLTAFDEAIMALPLAEPGNPDPKAPVAESEVEIIPVRTLTIKKVKSGDVSLRSVSRPKSTDVTLRSLNKALPPGQTNKASATVATSQVHAAPAKLEPWSWQRHSDAEYTDPAVDHSRRFRQKRKESNLRRKALEQEAEANRVEEEQLRIAADCAFEKDYLAEAKPESTKQASGSLINLESPPLAEYDTKPQLIDLLEEPLRKTSGASHSANFADLLDLWQAMTTTSCARAIPVV